MKKQKNPEKSDMIKILILLSEMDKKTKKNSKSSKKIDKK